MDGEAVAMTLTKTIIAEAISKKMSCPNNESLEMVDSLLEIMKQTLESGEDVLISGFGKFSVKEKRERKQAWAWLKGKIKEKKEEGGEVGCVLEEEWKKRKKKGKRCFR